MNIYFILGLICFVLSCINATKEDYKSKQYERDYAKVKEFFMNDSDILNLDQLKWLFNLLHRFNKLSKLERKALLKNLEENIKEKERGAKK